MFAPEAAKLFGRCGSHCIVQLGNTLKRSELAGVKISKKLDRFEKYGFACGIKPLSLGSQALDPTVCLRNWVLVAAEENTQDLIYGLYSRKSDIDLIRERYNRVLMATFMPNADQLKFTTEEIIEASKALLDAHIAKGKSVKFTLSAIQDLKGVINGTANRIPKVTREEILYIKENWARMQGNVKWYAAGKEVSAPWLWTDPWIKP
jgi:hypothetical protein